MKLNKNQHRKSARAKSSSIETLFVPDQNYAPVLEKILAQARSSIDISAYAFSTLRDRANLPAKIARLIIKIKSELADGIRIRLYYENHRDTALRNSKTASMLEDHGIEIFPGETHVKGVLVDRKLLLFGSTNLTHQSLTKNYETNLFTTSSAVTSQFAKYFDACCEGSGHGEKKVRTPCFADGDFLKPLLASIRSAKDTIDFSIYFFDHPAIIEALEQAHARGVKISGLVHDHATFALAYVGRTRRTVAKLKKAGIENIVFGPRHLFSHAKCISFDRTDCMIGSGNWIAEDINVHSQFYVKLDDAGLSQQVSNYIHEKSLLVKSGESGKHIPFKHHSATSCQ